MERTRLWTTAAVLMISGFAVQGCGLFSDIFGLDRDDPPPAPPPAPPPPAPYRPPMRPPVPDPPPEEKTVGKLCNNDADCEVAGSVGDNVCSIGFFTIGDVYGDPVCVSACKRGPGQTFGDVLCDGDEQSAPGLCGADNPGELGVCFPLCAFTSAKIETECQGSNACTAAYFAKASDDTVFSLGKCLGGCKSDADCKGSPDARCQVESALCVSPANYKTFTKLPATGCIGSSFEECNCKTAGGTGPNANRGYCTLSCVTGSAGDAACNAAAAGWKCSAALPTTFTDGKPAFTAQPDGILGTCAQPCFLDADCDALAASVNQGSGTATMKCDATAGSPTCVGQ